MSKQIGLTCLLFIHLRLQRRLRIDRCGDRAIQFGFCLGFHFFEVIEIGLSDVAAFDDSFCNTNAA
ncbi:MAG: hypothetical protein DKT66_14310 [Candidatus Melainabacteria bacterium]|nr:MAG: hypothetical protein DKT66_14310 [Candidatus Melainabacteria bacterium]